MATVGDAGFVEDLQPVGFVGIGISDSIDAWLQWSADLEYSYYSFNYEWSVEHVDYSTSSRFGYLSVPVAVRWFPEPGYFLGGGLSLGYLVHRSVSETANSDSIGLYNPQTDEVEGHEPWNVGLRLVMGIQEKKWQLEGGFDASLEPTMRLGLGRPGQQYLRGPFLKFSYFFADLGKDRE